MKCLVNHSMTATWSELLPIDKKVGTFIWFNLTFYIIRQQDCNSFNFKYKKYRFAFISLEHSLLLKHVLLKPLTSLQKLKTTDV